MNIFPTVLCLGILVANSASAGTSNRPDLTDEPRSIAMSWAEKAFQISGDDLFRRAFFKLDEAQITWPARNERILAYCDYNTYAYVFATNPLRAKEIYFCAEVSDIAGTPSTLAQILLHESFHLITQKTDECFVTRLVKRTFETIHEPIAFEDAYMRGGCH